MRGRIDVGHFYAKCFIYFREQEGRFGDFKFNRLLACSSGNHGISFGTAPNSKACEGPQRRMM